MRGSLAVAADTKSCLLINASPDLTLAALAQNAIFGVLASDVVTRKAVVAAAAFMEADAIAAEIIKGCTGEVAFAEPVNELAKSYAAPREEISALFCGACRQKARGVVIEATTKPLVRWPCGRAGFRNAA